MKLRLPHKLQAALVAAFTAVAFTAPQAFAIDPITLHETTFTVQMTSPQQNVTDKSQNFIVDASNWGNGSSATTWGGLYVTEGGGLKTNNQNCHWTMTYLYVNPAVAFQASTNNVPNEINWSNNSTSNYFDVAGEGAWVDINKDYGRNIHTNSMSNGTVYLNDKGSLTSALNNTNTVVATLLTSDYEGVAGYEVDSRTGVLTRTLMRGDFSSWQTPSASITLSNLGDLDQSKLSYVANNTGLYVTYQLFTPTTYTWSGTPEKHDWSDPVWNGESSYVANNGVEFGSAGHPVVTISTTVAAGDVTIGGQDYTFNIQNGGSLTATNFAVAGGNQTVNLNGGSLTPGNVTIATGASLSITGSGDMSISSLAGEGGLNKNGSGTLSISGHDSFSGAITVNAGKLTLSAMGAGTYSVASGAAIEVINANMASVGTLTVTGDGTVRLVTTSRSENNNALGTLSAANLKLADNSDHSGRYYYGSSSNLSGVDHLYFDGGQLWLTGAAMTFAGAVTFNATTYTENNQPILAGAVMRLDKNATFSGAVEVAQTTKLAFAADGTVVTFGGNVTGSGQLDLKSWSNKTGTFKVSGNATTYTGAITTDSNITLAVEQNGQLTLGDGSTLNGAVTLAGALTVNGSATVNGTLTQTGGSITVNEGKSLTLGNASLTSAISSTGTVVFTQNITASGLQKVGEDDTYAVGADGARATDENYFNGTRTESTIRVVTGGTVTTGDHTVTQGGVAYALKTDGTATGVTADEVNYSAFYQGQAGTTVTVSQLAVTAEAHDSELSAVFSIGSYDAPTVLNVDQGLETAQVAFSAVNIASDVEYTGHLLIYGGMNTVGGQIGTDRLAFFGGNASVTTFTDAPVVDSGVRFSSDAGVGGVQVQANQRSGDAQSNYYYYSIGDASYSVVASELSKEGEGAATVANSLMVQRIHNSEESSTDKLTLSAGAVNMSLQEVVATSGDIEFLNMAAANGTQEGKQTSVYLNNLEIGSEMTVSFYEAAAPSYEGEVVAETAVTVTGTLTAGWDATLNADLVLGKKTHESAVAVLDVSAMEGIGGLNMGSTVTLKPGELSLSDADMAMVLALDPNDMYDLFNGVDRFFVGTNVYSQIGISDAWVNARDVFANDFGEKDYYLFYSGANQGGVGGNVGTIYIMQMPEPTTGTLSLLALCALAARRRRK